MVDETNDTGARQLEPEAPVQTQGKEHEQTEAGFTGLLAPAEAAEEESEAAQIRRYLTRGFSFVQLTKDMGFDPRSVRRELEKVVVPENNGTGKGDARDSVLPMVRKTGGGAEVLTPEGMLLRYMGGTPEGEIELKAIMKFRAAMLMVMDLVDIQKGSAEADAKRMEPILRLMKETREEQDAAAARAKASSEDIADRAAQEMAAHVVGAMSRNQTQVNGSLEQLRQMVTGKNDDPFSKMLSMMQSMQQLSQMFGMSLPGGLPGMQPGMAGDTNMAAGATVEPPPIEKHSKAEWEENTNA